jgi:phosphosulfolactate synthase (CoM biosynthesis protein A)
VTTKQEWRQVVPALISIPSKPRRNGLTMMIDKGLGMHSFAETLSMGAEYIDFIKLGFGTALLYPSGILEQKVRMAQERGIAIYPGGTLLEVAEMTETFEQFLDQAVAWGITHVEISDGTIPLSAARRVEMIRSAAKRGLRVITEIGKKTKNHPVDADFVLEQMTRDLDAGAEYVINVLETGKDLRGTAWPEITETAKQLDRIMLIPLMNPDGRARVPMRMETNKGPDMDCHEYLNIGCWADGNRIVWPMCKTLIPMDFDQVEFPGGYPNDAGVNIQHDDFFGKRQPETEALFALCARERPDLIMHMHTGAPFRNYFMRMLRDFCEPALTPVFEQLYARVHTRLALEGLQSSNDPAVEADPTQSSLGPFNLTSALNLHCGALNVVMESPSHGFSGYDRQGELVTHSPEMLLDAQLYCHLEAMRFLAEKGGRIKWAPGRNRKA